MKISHTAVDKYCGRTADLATVYNIFLGTAETLAGDSNDLSFGALTLLAGWREGHLANKTRLTYPEDSPSEQVWEETDAELAQLEKGMPFPTEVRWQINSWQGHTTGQGHCLWSPYVIGQTIIFSSCGFYLLLSFFSSPNLSGQRLDVCLPYFGTWCGPSLNLECRSEMCCTQLAGNAEPKKSPKICHLGTIAQLCQAISSQLRDVWKIGKKLVKQHLPHTPSQYVELRPTSGWDPFVSLGHPS